MLFHVVRKLWGDEEIPQKNYTLPKLTKEGMEKLNSPITVKELKFVDRNLPYKKNLRSRWPHWCFLLNIQGIDNSNTTQILRANKNKGNTS